MTPVCVHFHSPGVHMDRHGPPIVEHLLHFFAMPKHNRVWFPRWKGRFQFDPESVRHSCVFSPCPFFSARPSSEQGWFRQATVPTFLASRRLKPGSFSAQLRSSRNSRRGTRTPSSTSTATPPTGSKSPTGGTKRSIWPAGISRTTSTTSTNGPFPSTSLEAGEYLVVFASEKDRAVSGEQLHTNFALSGDGEYLALVSSDGPHGRLRFWAIAFRSN